MVSDAQRRASRKYDQANTKNYPIKINRKTESEIFNHLERCENVNGYIKELIKQDMKNAK